MSKGYQVYRSGFVQRYAQNPDMAWTCQTDGHHQWGVAMLLFHLFPDDVTLPLIWEALHHDTGEMGAAEVSGPAKRRHPALAAAVADAESNERIEMEVAEAYLPDNEAVMLRFCDDLEAYLFAKVRTPWVLTGADWPEMRADLLKRAAALGVTEKVRGLVA